MKFLDSLGGFVLDHIVWFGLFFGVAFGVLITINSAQEVSLDSKHWECTMSKPKGIKAICVDYHYKGD